MTERISSLMIAKGLLNKYQYGFQKKKSAIHHLLRLSEHISKWLNTRPNGRTISVFIDAEKAFDTVWSNGVRKMLIDENFPPILIRWVSSWMENRTCRVRINQAISHKVQLTAGLAQGSLLSPIVYIFFTRNMPTKAKNDFLSSFYADDTSYASPDSSHGNRKSFAGDSLQIVLAELQHFCSLWRIGLNVPKTKLLLFKLKQNHGPQNTVPNLWLRSDLLKYEDSVKFLGITFDQELTF